MKQIKAICFLVIFASLAMICAGATHQVVSLIAAILFTVIAYAVDDERTEADGTEFRY